MTDWRHLIESRAGRVKREGMEGGEEYQEGYQKRASESERRQERAREGEKEIGRERETRALRNRWDTSEIHHISTVKKKRGEKKEKERAWEDLHTARRKENNRIKPGF